MKIRQTVILEVEVESGWVSLNEGLKDGDDIAVYRYEDTDTESKLMTFTGKLRRKILGTIVGG